MKENMLALKLLVLVSSLSGALADYPCLCAYAVETLIYDQPDTSSNVMGYMYEFDCKPVYQVDSKPDGWQTVASEHQIGYVENVTTVEVQVCQGSVPDEDKVTTKVPPVTTRIVTTLPPTPAPTQAPTTATTSTAAPTTQAPTTATTSTAAPTTQAPTTATSSTAAPTTQAPTTATTSTAAPTTQAPTTATTSTAAPITQSTTTTTPTTQMPTTTPTPPTTTKTTATTTTTTTTPQPTTTMTTTTTTTTTTPRPTTTTTTTTPKPTTTQYVPSCPTSVIRRSKLSYVFKHGSYCYEFRESVADWYQARADCQQNGGFLLTIHSQDEQTFVQSMLTTNLRKTYPIWLGLYDEAHEENWQWVSGDWDTSYINIIYALSPGHSLKYDNWMPGRYHDKYHSFENCGLYVPARMGQWDDVKCRGELFSAPAKHQWICQYRLQTSHATGPLG